VRTTRLEVLQDLLALEACFCFQAAVGLPVTAFDVLPVNKRCTGGHQGLVDVPATASDLSNGAPVAIGGLDAQIG